MTSSNVFIAAICGIGHTWPSRSPLDQAAENNCRVGGQTGASPRLEWRQNDVTWAWLRQAGTPLACWQKTGTPLATNFALSNKDILSLTFFTQHRPHPCFLRQVHLQPCFFRQRRLQPCFFRQGHFQPIVLLQSHYSPVLPSMALPGKPSLSHQPPIFSLYCVYFHYLIPYKCINK